MNKGYMNKRGEGGTTSVLRSFIIMAIILIVFVVFILYGPFSDSIDKVKAASDSVPMEDSVYGIKNIFGGFQKERLEDFDNVFENNICIESTADKEGDNQETLRTKRSNLVALFDELEKIKDEDEKEKRSVKLEEEIKRCDTLSNQLKGEGA